MLCVSSGILRPVLLAEEPDFGTSSASVSPAAVAPACSLALEGGSRGGGWVCKPRGLGVGAGGCPRAGGALGEACGPGSGLCLLKKCITGTFQGWSLIELVITCYQL